MTKKIVKKIEDGTNREDVLCTTYQMRNMYKQLGGAFFSTLDIMNYIQHHQITKWCKASYHILDVCCGRGLMLPLLRYNCKDIGSYTGVDIEPKNVEFLHNRVFDNKEIEPETYYPFPVQYIQSNVSEMSDVLDRKFDLIIYTSSIEHMHKDDGLQSLSECRKVAKRGATLILTCPNTPEDQSGYDTQYSAHVYEWKRSELLTGLFQSCWKVEDEYGLLINYRDLKGIAGDLPIERLHKFIPNEWLLPVLAPLFPEQSKEIGIIAKAV